MKRSILIAVALLLAISMVVHAAGAKEATAKTVAPQTLRLGHTIPPTHPAHEAMLALAAELAERTKGELKLEVFPAAQLGGARDLIEATIRGTQDFAFDGPGWISQFFPRIAVLDMPFMFANYQEFQKVYASDFGKELRSELLQKTGLRVLDIGYWGARQITSNRPIRRLEDFRGFKIRVMPVEEPFETFRALGASPTPIAFGEVYFSLKTNVVEGQENPLSTIHAFKFFEVQKYITLSNHQIGSLWLMANDKRWASFTEDQRRAFTAAARRALEAYDTRIFEDEKSLIDTLSKAGIEFITMTEADRNEIKKTVRQIFPKFEGKWGAGNADRIQAILDK